MVSKVEEAQNILKLLELPEQQQNKIAALCLLALLDLNEKSLWKNATSPLIGITPIMKWVADNFNEVYAPNTRETFRRQAMHQFEEAGIVIKNPDDLTRAINSGKTVYQVTPSFLKLMQNYTHADFEKTLVDFKLNQPTLIEKYAKEREMLLVPIKVSNNKSIKLSPGAHSILIKQIVEDFASRFTPKGKLLYVGDTGNKNVFFDKELLSDLGIILDKHGKMPDVVIHYTEKNWLVLVEAVTSHGPVDGKRYEELKKLFASSTAGLVYVSAFPSREIFLNHSKSIAWETEVWIADAPTHMIHFNGSRFLGPYTSNN